MSIEATPDQEARRGAENYKTALTEYITAWWERDDGENLPTNHSTDYYVRVLCYGGGPEGGVEFKVTDDGTDWQTCHTWHREWGSSYQYAELEDEYADWLWDYFGLAEQ